MFGSRARKPYAISAVCAMLALSALPAAAWAASRGSDPGSGSGGSGLTGAGPAGSSSASSTGSAASGTPSSSTPSSAPVVTESGPVVVTGNGVTFEASASAMFHRKLTLSGTAPQNLAGQTVEIELSRAAGWVPIASAPIAAGGAFTTTWWASQSGQVTLRAVVAGGSSSATAQTAAATPALTVTVYRPTLATQYGPGFYGHYTACGEKLGRNTLGVASRTLRCGTEVSFYYRGRTIVVPVIDRGPYGTKASWDLTEATGRALGLPGTGHLGAVSVPAPVQAGG